MTYRIVPFDAAHLPQVVEMSLRAWAPVFAKLRPAVQDFVYDAFYPNGWQARQAADIEAFLLAEGAQCWIASDGQAVLGWIGIRLHAEDCMGEIYILVVDPAHQRRGISKALMDVATAQMRESGMQIVMVETGDDPGHAPSRATYEAAGFSRWPVARYFRKL
jgi:GNAT superfamily N-acetyltransferase